jgi:penicillin-binding protein 2
VTESKTRTRLKVLAILVIIMFAALTTRLWFLQVLASDQFSKLAKTNQIRLVPITPLRGEILDRNGNILVGNRPSTVLLVDRSQLGSQGEAVLSRLSKLLHIPATDIVDRLNSVKYLPYQPIPVAEDVPKQKVFYIEEHHDQFPGVSYRLDSVRYNPQGSLAAHALGYLGPVSPEQLKESAFALYQPNEMVGQGGVEAAYERYLHGTDGTRAIQINAQGHVLDNDFGGHAATPGDNVVLSIDEGIQRLAEQSLSLGIQLARNTPDKASGRYLSATGGAVIVMDPRNGQVLALASNPTYDPSIFLNGLSGADATSLDLNPDVPPTHNRPFLDRAIQGLYPPGSTFKPFIAAGALKEGYASENGSYDCPAGYIAPIDVQHHVFHNWDPVDRGYISLPQALTISCDTVFYQYGYDFWLHYFRSGKTDEQFQRDLGQMGFGQFTHIDLPGEQTGLIPTYEYVKRVFAANPKVYGTFEGWLPGDAISLSIGQGFITVTPLQMAMAYSAIANGGTLFQPHVAWKIESPAGKVKGTIAPKAMGRLPISPQRVAFLRNALTNVPLSGTASAAFAGFPLTEIPVAGKTGTADIPPKQPISWFAGMAPANHPQYVVVAMVEQGGHGATTAAPIVRRILEGLFGLSTPDRLKAGNVVD